MLEKGSDREGQGRGKVEEKQPAGRGQEQERD